MSMDDYDLANRLLPDGRMVRLSPMTFGKVRLCVHPSATSLIYDDGY